MEPGPGPPSVRSEHSTPSSSRPKRLNLPDDSNGNLRSRSSSFSSSLSSSRTCENVFRSKVLLTRRAAKMKEFFHAKQLCDIFLVSANGQEIGAHKLVLASVSDYFAAMFLGPMLEATSARIELHGVEPGALASLVEYCYSGELELDESRVEALLSAACLLQIDEVIGACSDFLASQLHPSNALGIRAFADAQGCRELYRSAAWYTFSHFVEISRSPEYLLLSVDDLLSLLSSDDLNVPSETLVVEALVRWLSFDIPFRRVHVGRLFSAVRLALLAPEFIADEIETHEMFKSERVCQELILDALKLQLMPGRVDTTSSRNRPRKSTVGRLFLVGGMDTNKGSLSIDEYSLLRDEWSVSGQLSARRLQFGVTVVDGKLYVVGGRDGLKTLPNFEAWDPVASSWTQMPPMNTPRHGLGVAALDPTQSSVGVVYAVGGHDGWAYLSSVERFDPITRTWSYIAEMSAPRSTVGVAMLDSKLYAVGGRDGSQCLRSVECYNPHTNKWYSCAPMARRRGGIGVGVMHGCLYAVGGVDVPSSNPSSTRFACVERYDPRSDEWTSVANLSVGRDAVAVTTLAGMLFAIGGYNGGQDYLKVVECYEPAKNEWRRIADLVGGRAGACAVVVPHVEPRRATQSH